MRKGLAGFLLVLLALSATAQPQDPFWTWVAAAKSDGPDRNSALAAIVQSYQAGNPTEGVVIGYLYLDGVVYPRDLNKAWDFFSWAQGRGSTWGATWMALMLGNRYRRIGSDAEDYQRAGELLRGAMEKGNLTAQAVYGVALILGTGVPRDPAKGLRLIQDAAEKGDPMGKYQLGRIYNTPGGLPGLLEPDPAKARALFEEAVKAGIFGAFGRLAYLLYFGLGGDPDPKRAVSLAKPYVGFETYATLVYLLALYHGNGIAQDKAEACRLAAGPEGKVAPGYNAYVQALCLKEAGRKVEAYAYLLKASGLRVPEAERLLKEWEKELTQEELEQAKALFKSLP